MFDFDVFPTRHYVSVLFGKLDPIRGHQRAFRAIIMRVKESKKIHLTPERKRAAVIQ